MQGISASAGKERTDRTGRRVEILNGFDRSSAIEGAINVVKMLFLYSARVVLPYIPLRALYLLGDFAGKLFVGEKIHIMKENVRMLLGNVSDAKLHNIVEHTMRNFRKDLFEIWTFPKLTQKKINKMSYFSGIEHLDSAMRKGKGVILCITHFGSWKIVLPALGYNGYKVNQVAANPQIFVRNEEMCSHNKIMELELECEASLPAEFFYVDAKKSVRSIYRALKDNKIVVISLDGVIGGSRMAVPFLNSEILLSTGAAALSYTTGAPSLPIFIVREKNNRHKIIIHGPIEFGRKIGKEEYVRKWIRAFALLFEEYVRKHPDHYARFLYTIRKYPLSEVGVILKQGRDNS